MQTQGFSGTPHAMANLTYNNNNNNHDDDDDDAHSMCTEISREHTELSVEEEEKEEMEQSDHVVEEFPESTCCQQLQNHHYHQQQQQQQHQQQSAAIDGNDTIISTPPPLPQSSSLPVLTLRDFVVLGLSSTIMVGLYYLIFLPASLRQDLKQAFQSQSGVMKNDESGSGRVNSYNNTSTSRRNDDDFETRFQLSFSLAYLPAVILPFYTGTLVDRIGSRICLVILSATCVLGQVISSLGVKRTSWAALLVGRFIFGVGFESLFVSNQAFLTHVFAPKGRDGMALAVSAAASYVGFLLSPILSPMLCHSISLEFAFWFGSILIGLSLMSATVIFWLELDDGKIESSTSTKNAPQLSWRRQRKFKRSVGPVSDNTIDLEKADQQNKNDDVRNVDHTESFHIDYPSTPSSQNLSRRKTKACCLLSNFRRYPTSFWMIATICALVYGVTTSFHGAASGVLMNHFLFIENPSSRDCQQLNPDQCTSGSLVPLGTTNPSLDTYDQLCHIGGRQYAPPLPHSIKIISDQSSWANDKYDFPNLEPADVDCSDPFWSDACTADYCQQQQAAAQKAGIYMALPFIVTVLTTFLFGHYGVDRAGFCFEMIAIGPMVLVMGHILIIFENFASTHADIIAPIAFGLIGIGFSVEISAIWPAVPLIIEDPEIFGKAIGLMDCIQALGNFSFPLIALAIYKAGGETYLPGLEIFTISCLGVAILIGVALVVSKHLKKS